MHGLGLVIAVAAATVLALGHVSEGLQRRPLSRPLLAMLAGVAAGPSAVEWLDDFA